MDRKGMRSIIDTNILLGWLLKDDDFHTASRAFFKEYHYGELDIVHYTLVDLQNLVRVEANFTIVELLKSHSANELESIPLEDAKRLVRERVDKITKRVNHKHVGLKEEIKDIICDALEKGDVSNAIVSAPLILPKMLKDRITGCLGHGHCKINHDAASDIVTVEQREHIRDLVTNSQIRFGGRDGADRKILFELLVGTYVSEITFYTYDQRFYSGYLRFQDEVRSTEPELVSKLNFIHVNSGLNSVGDSS